MSLLETKFYLILSDKNGQYLDAAAFPALTGVAGKINDWRKDAKHFNRTGDRVVRCKVSQIIDLDLPTAKKGKKKA